MHLEKHFDVQVPRETAVSVVGCDETLQDLFPDARVDIIKSDGNRRTVLTHYTALGQEGTAKFHFTFDDDGVSFSKVCDGRVWKKLIGTVTLEARGKGTRVHIEYDGATKAFVPEFTIRGPMQSQLDQMAEVLRDKIKSTA